MLLSKMRVSTCLFSAAAALVLVVPVRAADAPASLPFVSPIFGDKMVLQRGKPNTFWGWTTPGRSVTVTIGDHSGSGVADADGRWQARVEPPAAGQECTVRIDGPDDGHGLGAEVKTTNPSKTHVVLRHVVVGDVWLCGGQSNMEFPLTRAKNGSAEVAAAHNPHIRFFRVGTRSGYGPVAVPTGRWETCTPQTVRNSELSAVAYFFAQRINHDTGIPIGLVQDCLGGTPVETWMSPAAIRATHQFDVPLAEVERLREKHAPEYGNYIMHWYDEYDLGIRGQSWAAPDLDDHAWKTVPVPGGFEALGLADVPAVVWFRKEIELPDPLPAGDASIHLGVVEKMETTFVNGQWVGASSWVENPRIYRVPARLLKPGANLITVRVLKLKSKGAFLSSPDTLQLVLGNGTRIPLAGAWKAAVSVNAAPPHPLPLGYENYPIMPTVLYQGIRADLFCGVSF